MAAVAVLLSACEHKDLCFNHPEHAPTGHTVLRADYDRAWEIPLQGGREWQASWPLDFGRSYESLRPPIPGGICVTTYTPHGQRHASDLAATGGKILMAPGQNSVLVYNNDTEYIIFNDMNVSVSAKATTRGRSRASYIRNPLYRPESAAERQEYTVSPPDPLFVYYNPEYTQKSLPEPQILDAVLHPLVFSYLVRYEFSGGIGYAGLARGALAGMARSVYLHDGHTGSEQATVLYDCQIYPWGVEAVVRTFGVPDHPAADYSRIPGSFGLNLEVMLRNGNTVRFDFDVTDQVSAQPHGGVIEVKGLRITDAEGGADGSGFDVTVEGWGDFEDIPVPL